VLTAHGLSEKATITLRFLKRKMQVYETLQGEIRELMEQASQFDTSASAAQKADAASREAGDG
jgi:hypothetical protein